MDLLASALGNWWSFAGVAALTSVVFGHLLPQAQAPIFLRALPALPRKPLNEYLWTWTPLAAERFFDGIGAEGRAALRRYHASIGFWLPLPMATLCCASLLLLAFPGLPAISLLALLAGGLVLAENLIQRALAASYPALSPAALRHGPAVTRAKWLFALAIGALAVIGFLAQLIEATA